PAPPQTYPPPLHDALPIYERDGATLCVSTQAGCPIGCPFCASGQLGLARNLAAHEILEQYVRGQSLGRLSRSVVMGMGEPLLNLDRKSTRLNSSHVKISYA